MTTPEVLYILTWTTHGENCEMCSRLDGTTMTEDEWSASIQPGFHDNCDCTLEVTGVLELDEEAFDMLAHIKNRLRVSAQTINDGWASRKSLAAMGPRPDPQNAHNPGYNIPLYERIR